VVALDHGEVLLPVVGSVGPGDDRVSLDPANRWITGCPEVAKVVDRGHAEVFVVGRGRAQRAGIDAQGQRINIVVDRDALGKTLITEATLQHHGRADRPGVIESDQLGPAGSDRIPHAVARGQRAQGLGHAGGRRLTLKTVAEEIFERKMMARVKGVVELDVKVAHIEGIVRGDVDQLPRARRQRQE